MTKLIDADSGEVLLNTLEIADTFWKRFIGLQFQNPLPPSSGLLIRPCSSIHTCFMRFPIDAIMMDNTGVVLGFKRNLKPWRILFCPRRTSQIIETNVDAFAVTLGATLKVS